MKKTILLKYKIILFLLLTGVRVVPAALHNPVVLSKEIRIATMTNGQAMLEIASKYGNMTFQNWDKDSLVVDISITVTAGTEKSAENLISNIDVDRIVSPDYISLATQFHENKSNLGKQIGKIVDLTRGLLGENRIEVNFNVWMPPGTRLKLENRFGNVILPIVTRELALDLQHGNLHAETIESARQVSNMYGNMHIRKINSGTISQAFGNLVIDEIDELTLQTKTSSVIIGQANKIHLESTHDSYIIDRVNTLKGKASYDNISIKMLMEAIDLICKFGDLTISNSGPSFSNINIDADYTSIVMYTSPDASFDFTLNTEYSQGIRVPATATITTDEQTDDRRLVRGISGKGNPVGKVHISSKHGFVKIGNTD